jgi:hypothetical protein
LKVNGEGSEWYDNISTEAIVGAAAGGVCILLMVFAVFCYFLRPKK